ncbi:MAG: ABC transporter permease [Armatimonadetes bacterium]|nr:ABC transporter permease [Armatimonadota bacterium]
MTLRIPREAGVIVALTVVVAYFSWRAPQFATPDNLLTAARQYAEVALIATGMTLVILTGGIDLSVGSTAGLAGMAAGLLALRAPSPLLFALLSAVGIGLLIGGLNGGLIGGLRLSPVIVTLATWAGARSLAYVLTHGDPVSGLPDPVIALADTWVAGYVPATAILAGAVAVAASLALRRTAYGRSLIAQGQNERAALFSGIPVGRLGVSVYTLTGALAGLAGLLIAARAETAVPDAGMGLEFEVITAVVLGGTRIDGGYASVLGTILGVATLGLLHNGCNLLGIDSTWQTLAIGFLLLGAVILDSRVGNS